MAEHNKVSSSWYVSLQVGVGSILWNLWNKLMEVLLPETCSLLFPIQQKRRMWRALHYNYTVASHAVCTHSLQAGTCPTATSTLVYLGSAVLCVLEGKKSQILVSTAISTLVLVLLSSSYSSSYSHDAAGAVEAGKFITDSSQGECSSVRLTEYLLNFYMPKPWLLRTQREMRQGPFPQGQKIWVREINKRYTRDYSQYFTCIIIPIL